MRLILGTYLLAVLLPFAVALLPTLQFTPHHSRLHSTSDSSSDDTSKEDAWDADVEYDKEWPQEKSTPDPSTAWDALPNMPEAPKLGIDISLEPLNEKEAAELRKDAEAIINSRIDEGIQDIEKLRAKMSKEMEQSRKIMQMASELEAKKKTDELMKKIDDMTGKFLDSTKETRTSTKMAAAASRAMEGTGRGLEMGTWGTLAGRTVVASDSKSLLGSIDNAVQAQQKKSGASSVVGDDTLEVAPVENRILIVADVKQVRLNVRIRLVCRGCVQVALSHICYNFTS